MGLTASKGCLHCHQAASLQEERGYLWLLAMFTLKPGQGTVGRRFSTLVLQCLWLVEFQTNSSRLCAEGWMEIVKWSVEGVQGNPISLPDWL